VNVREKKHRLPRDAYRGRICVSTTACVAERRCPFVNAAIVHPFRDKLEAAASKGSCRVLVYCFMPDHLHLILQGIDDTADAWRAMVDFKQQSGCWFGRSDEDLGAHVRYVADNPVRWGLVGSWQDYPFTGAIGVALLTVMADCATL
jgi:putative transposase